MLIFGTLAVLGQYLMALYLTYDCQALDSTAFCRTQLFDLIHKNHLRAIMP